MSTSSVRRPPMLSRKVVAEAVRSSASAVSPDEPARAAAPAIEKDVAASSCTTPSPVREVSANLMSEARRVEGAVASKTPRWTLMRKHLVFALFLIGSVVGTSLAVGSTAAGSPAGRLVSEVAAAGTPHVLDGRDLSVAQVGSTMILGGTFTQARNDDSSTVLTRNRLLAFDVSTGHISTTFNPNPN